MADSKITELTELVVIADGDFFPIVDVSEIPQTTKKISAENAIKNDSDVAASTTHRSQTDNPHAVSKSQVGLGNADNTSDINKPVSTAQGLAITAVGDDLTTHENDAANPHSVTKGQVGLGSADNTSDADKPISDATQIALDNAGGDLTDHENDSANPHAVSKSQVGLGSADNTSDAEKPVSTAQATAIGVVQTNLTNHENDSGNPHSVIKSQIGLGSVDNTSDADKPISDDTQTALDQKYNASNPNGYETPGELDSRDSANRARANHTGTQLSSTISNFAATVRSTILTGISFASILPVLATDTILIALGKLQSQIDRRGKGFLQYLNAATINVNEGQGFETLVLGTNRESFPNSLFTKTSTTNFRADFDGIVEINFSTIVENDNNDRGHAIRVRRNGVVIPQGDFDNIMGGKKDNDRDAFNSASFKANCSDGDIFDIQLSSIGDANINIAAGDAVFGIGCYWINL